MTSAQTSTSFTVKYDSAIKINRQTLDNRDITVVGPNGYNQRAKLDVIDKAIDHRRLYARYSVTPPAGLWSNSDNGEYEILINQGEVRDLANTPTRLRLAGSFEVAVPPGSLGATQPPMPGDTIRVRDFGAIPDDGIDDSLAIQAAIDSLPLSAGVPNGMSPIGGIVSFEAGEYKLTRAIRITSGQWLRGVGNQTLLHNFSTVKNDTAIQAYSAYGHGGIFGTRVQDLRIVTDAARGFQIDPNNGGDVNNLRLENLTISSGNIAIDARPIDVYQSLFSNITIENPGAAAIWLRVDRQNSAINAVKNFTVRGPARAIFDASEPLVTLGGQMIIQGMTIEDLGKPVMPFYTYDMRGTAQAVSIQTSSANLVNAEQMRMYRSWVEFDQIDSLASTRRVRLIQTKDAHFVNATVAPGSTLAQSLVVDITSHVTISNLYGGQTIGTLPPGRVTVRTVSEFGLPVSTTTPPAVLNTGPASPVVVNVQNFGAFGNDGLDDTTAVQAAINSLPLGNGVPGTGTGTTVGGTVIFPIGTYITTAPLRVPSGVWLVGNAWGTTLRNMSTNRLSPGILFVANSRGMNIGAGVVNFGIHTFGGAAITVDSRVTRGLFNVRLANIAIASASVGIDVRSAPVHHAVVDSIFVRDPGDTSLWLGNEYSTDNLISFVQVIGNTPSSTQPEKAHVVLLGGTTFEYGWLELNGIGALPLFVSGASTIRSLWCENHSSALPEDVIISFENMTKLDVDILLLVDDQHKLKFRNSKNVRFKMLDIAGRTLPLAQTLNLDAVSRININTVNAIFDAGMLDDPRVTVDGVYNQNAKTYVDTKTALLGDNLLADPLMSDIGDASSPHAWTIWFGDNYGAVTGTYKVDQTPAGPRLKVVITSDPNNRGVRIDPRLIIPDSHYGKQAVLRYRVDGPGPMIAWGENFNYQYAGRVSNSLTAVAATTFISASTQLSLILPPGVGTYYISNIGVIANR